MNGALKVSLEQESPIPVDASFECAPGDILALVGPSGSGKSTLLRAIAGLNKVQSGRIECGGSVWFDTASNTNAAPQARRCGLVFQSFALFPHMTALDNVAVAVESSSLALRRERALGWLKSVNMDGLQNRLPSALSGGQRQRVAVARALAREPAVLLLDEPFSAVDQITRRKLQTELAELRDAMAMPVVLVTHDLTEAQLLADQVCVLHRGKTLQQGPIEHVMRAPASARVARLLDQRNLFSATVTAQNEDEGWTELDWFDRPLRCRYSNIFRPGDSVAWLVPRGYVRMHRPDHPSSGDDENAVSGEIIELVVLGDEVQIAMTVEGVEGTLSFSVAVPVAERNALAKGVPVSVSLIAEGIHLMAAEQSM